MRSVSIVLLLVVVAVMAARGAVPPKSEREHYDINKAPEIFEKYIKDYNKSYKDAADKEAHYQAFVKALKQINKLNEQSSSAYFGINNFTDYTEEQVKNLHGLGPLS